MHQRFIAMQEEDPFVLEYMNLLGHREFGKGLQWLQVGSKPFQPNHPATEVECWLEYWIYLHSAVKQFKSKHCRMVDFDAIRSDPVVNLKQLLKTCGVDFPHKQLASKVSQEPSTNSNLSAIKSLNLIESAFCLKRNILVVDN
jgi:hypothetical protein